MSRLLDLLNPAPASDIDALSITVAPAVDTVGDRHQLHMRHPSITSPLEALAIAATSSPPGPSPPSATSPQIAANYHHQSHSNVNPQSEHTRVPRTHSFGQSQQPASTSSDHSRDSQPGESSKASRLASEPSREPSNEMEGVTTEPIATSSSESHHPSDADHSQPLHATPGSYLQRLTSRAGHDENHGHHQTPNQPSIASESARARTPTFASKEREATGEVMHSDFESGASQSQNLAHAGLADGAPDDFSAYNNSSTPLASTMMKRDNSTASQPTETKKRPAPKTDRKKGIASAIKRPPVKKRKVESESKDATPFSQRSGTPVSSRASKTPAPKSRQRGSATPANSSPAPGTRDLDTQDDDDMDDDATIFCICRKPDDHTWMIGCDGGCEDWFHGRCVNMNERDGNLIDKYICPNCVEAGIGQTTWKPMCRLETCREPARVTGSNRSKYCCDEHGVLYMKHRALGGNNKAADTNKSSAARRRRKDNHTDNFGNDDSVEDDLPDGEDGDDQAYLRGGILRARELKALTSGVKDLEEFKKLGEGVLSPPRTISPDDRDPTHDTESNGSTKAGGANVVYTTEESSQLQEIHAKKSALKRKREALDDREKLLSLVKARMKTVLEVLKKDGVKDICGFDARLSWSDEEFDNWRASVEGQRALGKGGILGAPTAAETGKSLDGDGDEKMVNGFDHEEEVGKGVCQKKRCERHKAWMKLQLTEINFEREECRMEMVRLDRGEKGVGERAMLRFLESGNDVVDEKQGGAEAVITRVVVADRAEDDLFTVSRNA